MPRLPRRRWLLAIALAATGFGSAAVTAQLQGDTAQETIQVQAGDILEILPVHSLPSATYSWILTQDRNFIEVARSAFYNTRLTTPGRFTLNAEVNAPAAGHAALRRVFAIDVLPRPPPSADAGAPPTEPAPSAAPLARALPEPDSGGRIILPQRQELLLLTPLRSDVLPLRLDLDARNDADDDGALTNDNDDAGTFFQTSGTPLHLWFTNAAEQRDITLHADSPDGIPIAQTLSILPAEYARQRGLFVSRVLIAAEERGPKAILFSPQFEDGSAPAIPLVFHWDFGDGAESIEERPLHEFAAYGTYSVRLSVRNIETGKELASRTKAVALQAPLIHDQRSSAPPLSLPPEPPPPQPSRSSFLRIAFVILGVAIGFAAVGFAAAWAYRAVQAYLLKQPPVPPAPAPAAPPKPAQPPKAAPSPPTVSVPAVKKPVPAPAAPDWLKKTAPPSPKPLPPFPQSPATPPPPSPTLPKPPPPPEPKQQSPAPAAIGVAPHPNPLPRGEGTTTPAKSPAPASPPQPKLPAPPRPPVPPKPIAPHPAVPVSESDRTIAIVQAENLPPSPKPPAPPSPPSPQTPPSP